MHLSRREFLENFLTFVGELGDAGVYTLAAAELNRALTRLWLKHEWRVYRLSTPYLQVLTVNQSRYALQDWVGRIGPGDHIRNISRDGSPLERIRDGQLLEQFPMAGTTAESAGMPAAFELAGACGVFLQPAVAGEALEVVSDSAADVDVYATVTGQDASGRWTRNQVLLAGTVAVAIGTWSYVDEFGKAYGASTTAATAGTSSRGTVTLRKASDHATELQKLFAQESAREHPVLTIYPKPSAADTLALPVIRKPKRLFHDSDPIPDMWEPALFEDMLLGWKLNTGESSAESAARAPRPALADLLATDNEQRGPSVTVPYMGR
jgi:hypothetical protein